MINPRIFRLALAAFALGAFALAASGAAAHNHPHKRASAQQESAVGTASGVVKAVDAAAGTITISHGPIEALSMPAMTMGFDVDDAALLEGIEPGAKVEFEVELKGEGEYLLRALRPQEP